MKRTLLIDADVVAFQAASALERAVEWDVGHWTWDVNYFEVINRCDLIIESMKEKLEADDVKLCLTDPHHNFRLDVMPDYKVSRKNNKRPLVLMYVKEWMVEEREGIMRDGLEGDDIMGILATRPGKDERIIVSIDKDMKTIPGKYVRTKATINEQGAEVYGAFDIQHISQDAADDFHMTQTLAGDITDGYSGCPGIGMTTAEKAITTLTGKRSYEHEIKRGPRKGETETRWEDYQCDDRWETVLSHYHAAGLTEDDALQQARVARILQASDYDFAKKEVKLWTPK